jgi:RHS repeat-associated protein
MGSRFSYGAKEMNPENGYFAMGARLYDAKLGRFLSRDPLAEMFPNHSSYSFAYNSPLNFSDPTGLAPEKEGKSDRVLGGLSDFADLVALSFELEMSIIEVLTIPAYRTAEIGVFGLSNDNDDAGTRAGITTKNNEALRPLIVVSSTKDNTNSQQNYDRVPKDDWAKKKQNLSQNHNVDNNVAMDQYGAHAMNNYHDIVGDNSKLSKGNKGSQANVSQNMNSLTFDNFYNSVLGRMIVPDFFHIGIGFNSIIGAGFNLNFDLTWITRGNDASWIPYVTMTEEAGAGFSFDGTINIGSANFFGNHNNISAEMLTTNSFANGGDFPTIWISGGAAAGGYAGFQVDGTYLQDFNTFILDREINIGTALPAGLLPYNFAVGASNTFRMKDIIDQKK